jgi:hypothetical protein
MKFREDMYNTYRTNFLIPPMPSALLLSIYKYITRTQRFLNIVWLSVSILLRAPAGARMEVTSIFSLYITSLHATVVLRNIGFQCTRRGSIIQHFCTRHVKCEHVQVSFTSPSCYLYPFVLESIKAKDFRARSYNVI